jgi:uncharacterized protein (TIGR03435 family)
MVTGLPKWADTQYWDITAKVPMTGEGAPNMVNGKPQPPPFSVGLENREVTVYALTVNGKSKLTRADESERSGCKPETNAAKPAPNAQMVVCKNTSTGELAVDLQQMAGTYIDHPIVDATGLEGGWDFTMGWTPKAQLLGSQTPNPNAEAGADSEAPVPNGISVFDAVEKELGLKLVKEKRSIPVIVVDHVDERPIE